MAEIPLVKHPMVESIRIYRRTAGAAILGGAILLTSACSALPGESSTPAPEVTASALASPAASPVATTAGPSVSAKIEAERKANKKVRDESLSLLKINGVDVTDKLVKTAKGEYPQIVVKKNGKYAKFDSSKHSGGLPNGWTKKDASKAQAFGMNFMLQEVVDSPVGGTADQVDAEFEKWKKRNASKFHPEVRSDFLSSDADENVPARDWQNYGDFAAANYQYPYDGVTPRVRSVNVTLTKSQQHHGGIYFEYTGTFTMNGQSRTNKNILETSDTKLSYTVAKSDGKYVIGGIQYDFSIDSDTLTAQLDPKK